MTTTKSKSSAPTLPDGWQLVRFDQMAENIGVRVDDPSAAGVERYVGLEHLDPESLKIRRWGKPEDVEATKLRFWPGDIIFGRRRAYQRKLAIADFEGICSAHALVLRGREDTVANDFLPLFMQSDMFYERALAISVGSLSPTINWKTLAVQQFAIPPKEEQHRIAEILWAADDTVEKYRASAYRLDNLRLISYQTWVNNRLSVEAWPVVTLADVCTIQSGQVDPRVPPYSNMIHIAPDDIESQTGRILEKKTAMEDGVTSGKYLFSAGAILYSKIRPNLRKVALVDFPGVCSADVYPVYAAVNIVPAYLLNVLLSEDFSAYALTCSVRSAIPKINRESLLSYAMKVPPTDEQVRLVAALDSFASATVALERKTTSSIQLKSTLLNSLLSYVMVKD